MCNRLGHPRIVDRSFLAEPIDSGVDLVRRMSLARETLPDLGFGEFTTAEHSQAVDVRAGFRLWPLGFRHRYAFTAPLPETANNRVETNAGTPSASATSARRVNRIVNVPSPSSES